MSGGNLTVYFETITISRNNVIQVWLHHPYRLLVCNLSDLIRREQESKEMGNYFTLDNVPYIEYRTLPAFQDCKMPVLWEVQPDDSLATPINPFAPREQFKLEREEFQRIVNTTRSLLRLHSS